MIAGILLALQVSAAAPATLTVRHAEAVRTVPRISTLSGTYLRADLLASALGGTVGSLPLGRYSITLGGSRIVLTEGVPFVRVDSNVVPMLLPPLRSGPTFLVPFQLASSVIPRFTSGFNYDVAADEIRIFNTAARRGVEAPSVGSGVASSPAVASVVPESVPARGSR